MAVYELRISDWSSDGCASDLPGEADYEIRRHGDVRPHSAEPIDDAAVLIRAMPAIHRGEDTIRAGLHRQMQERHQGRHVAMCGDQFVVHVPRMRRRVANPAQPVEDRKSTRLNSSH